MRLSIFPTFAGLKWGGTRTAMHRTGIRETASGREFRTRYWSFPRWAYRLSYEVLRQAEGLAELEGLVGFFNARGGSAEPFLYLDPNDCSAVDQHLGTGDGVSRQFQLVRTWGGVVEPVLGAADDVQVELGGQLVDRAGYVIDENGVVNFTAPVAAGLPVTWSGHFYWRVRFRQDQAEVSEFLRGLWEARSVELITVKR